ncbi:Lipoprotein-anchoring transpeptidase ErfK/SrfK [Rhizobium sp. NFR07]|uniref:L,D-transpeptidase family protein n=1 Tax=Rhizobium sp. NFR07 TaxID=1566262 RepID=UPI0008F00E5E|nr:L,D-transpeptidase [Rhizobium sp. NFR07]SFB59359.1 Lipoprotein-anchoring transpeptidase ErfK/SrfK [Rhizobium sp. NFR07]
MKNHSLVVLAFTLFSTVAKAENITADMVNSTAISAIATQRPLEISKEPDPAIVRLQVLLDRAGSSPGVIDGFYGENVNKAIAGFEAMNGLPVDGKLDPDVAAKLERNEPLIGSYEITVDDGQDIVTSIPEDYAKQAAMDHLGFTSVAEKLSERFHMDIELLKALNPGAQFSPGDTVFVTAPERPREGKVKRIEAHVRSGQVFAYDEADKILAVYPATIGSDDNPSPSGTHKVNGVAQMPKYTYNPKVNFQQGQNKKVLNLPSGPNNPVGTVWIDLSEPTYGIHGTPEPSKIDKAGSHGCIRLANWDVEELAAMVKPGVIVDILPQE